MGLVPSGPGLHVSLAFRGYLLAFGPSRHRAWVVGQRPIRYSLGSLGEVRKLVGGSVEACWGPDCSFLGDAFGLMGLSWGVLVEF